MLFWCYFTAARRNRIGRSRVRRKLVFAFRADRDLADGKALAEPGTEAPFPASPPRLDFRRPEATFRIQWYRVLGKTSGSSDERAGSGTAQCSRAAARDPQRHRAPDHESPRAAQHAVRGDAR